MIMSARSTMLLLCGVFPRRTTLVTAASPCISGFSANLSRHNFSTSGCRRAVTADNKFPNLESKDSTPQSTRFTSIVFTSKGNHDLRMNSIIGERSASCRLAPPNQ